MAATTKAIGDRRDGRLVVGTIAAEAGPQRVRIGDREHVVRAGVRGVLVTRSAAAELGDLWKEIG